MEKQSKSENNIFTADWGRDDPDTYTISKDGLAVARLVWDGNFSLQTEGEVELDPENLNELCDFVTSLKIDLYTEFPND